MPVNKDNLIFFLYVRSSSHSHRVLQKQSQKQSQKLITLFKAIKKEIIIYLLLPENIL